MVKIRFRLFYDEKIKTENNVPMTTKPKALVVGPLKRELFFAASLSKSVSLSVGNPFFFENLSFYNLYILQIY